MAPRKPVSAISPWIAEAQKLPTDELRTTVPVHVLFGESADVARFHKKYYRSLDGKDGQPARPGLDTVVDERRGLTARTADDILSLREAAQEANTHYLLAVSPKGAAPMEEGRFLVDEMCAVLEWYFDDGVENERDAQLASVLSAHAETPDSADALASELEDYAALASQHRKDIAGLGGFDAGHIDRARVVAEDVRNRPATPTVLTDEAQQALALRNRLCTLLHDRMSTVRGATRFVFRGYPDVIREATSTYERRRRAAARRKAAKKAPARDDQ